MMAEAIGFVASIVTILDSCTSCLKLLRDIHGAPKDQAKLIVVISSVKGVVHELQETTLHAQNAPNISRLKAIHSLVEEGSPLACLQDTLASLENQLNQIGSAKGIKKFGKRAGWSLIKEDIKMTLGVLKLHLKTLGLAFQNDTFLVTQDIYKKVRTIQEHTSATLQESSIIRKDVEKVGVSLDILTTTSKDNFQHIEGTIFASASKTSIDIGKISHQISNQFSMLSQENKQSLEKLQASIKQSGIRYTVQDFVNLDRYRRSHSPSHDRKNNIVEGGDVEDGGGDDGDDNEDDDDDEDCDGDGSEDDDGDGSEDDDGDASEDDDEDGSEDGDGDASEDDDGDTSEDDDGDGSEDDDGDDEDANEEEVFSSANSGYRCSDTSYTEYEQGHDSEYYSDGGYSTT
jgi:hypothetical protein